MKDSDHDSVVRRSRLYRPLRARRLASPRLADAVAASLAISSLSLCLIVTLTVLSIQASVTVPIPA